MPQMAPLMWTSLFTSFTIILLMVMIKISFSKSETQKNLMVGPTSTEQKKLNWKW